MKQAFYFTILLSAVLCTKVVAQEGSIFPKGEIATVDNHTGTVWLTELNTPVGWNAKFTLKLDFKLFKYPILGTLTYLWQKTLVEDNCKEDTSRILDSSSWQWTAT